MNGRQDKYGQDDFWDLSSLVPKRRSSPTTTAPATRSTATADIYVSAPSSATDTVKDAPLTERFVSPLVAAEMSGAPTPEVVYQPLGGLIRAVRIYPWKNEYTYYEQFRQHAERLADKEGRECPEVDFFSYMPQYTQLSREQLAYYLWWRSSFRRGVCLPAAYSYLLLYLYELINLDAAHLDPKVGQENMLRLWLSYREKHPRLDVLVREWLCDYSLLHRLPPPALEPAAYRTLLSGCRLKEFYVSADESADALGTAVLLFCNNYDYTKSKFYRPDTKEEYDQVLGGAIRESLAFLREQSGDALTDLSGVSTLSRDAFSGAVCSWRLKRRIEVDYTSFSHTHELRYIMTDVLKYAENALRANRGIKSRLSIYALSVPLRTRLDAYLEQALPPRRARVAPQKSQPIPDYERRYDLPISVVSPERAAAIEAESWQTTKRLVEAFSEDVVTFTPETGAKTPDVPADARHAMAVEPPLARLDAPTQDAAAPTSFAAALGELAAFLPLAQTRDRAAQRAFALKQGEMPDAIADKINTVAGDFVGDIILEEENGVYTVIEDYLEVLKEEGVL